MRGIAELDRSSVGIEIDGGLADSPKKDAVIAASFYGWRKITATVGVSPCSREGRLACHHPSSRKQATRSRQEAGDKGQNIIGAQRVRSRGDHFVEQPGSQAGPSQIPLIDFIRQHLFVDLTGPKIDQEDLAHVCIRHLRYSFPLVQP